MSDARHLMHIDTYRYTSIIKQIIKLFKSIMFKIKIRLALLKKNQLGLLTLFLVVMSVVALLHITTTTYIMTRAPWGTIIDGTDVGGQPTESIISLLPTQLIDFQLAASTPNRIYQLDSNELSITREYTRILDTIEATLNSPFHAWRWWMLSKIKPTTFQSPLIANDQELTKVVADLATQELEEGRPPSITLKRSGDINSLEVDPGENGFQLDEVQAKALIQFALSQNEKQVELPLQSTITALSPTQVEKLIDQAGSLVGESLTFTIPDQPINYKLSDVQFINLLTPPASSTVDSYVDTVGNPKLDPNQNLNLNSFDTIDTNSNTNQENSQPDQSTSSPITNPVANTQTDDIVTTSFDSSKLSSVVAVNQDLVTQIARDWSQKIDRPPQDPVFDVNPTSLKVTKFVPPLDGLVVNQIELQQLIARYLNQVVHQAKILELAKVANDPTLIEKVKGDPDQLASTLPLPLSVQPPTTSLADTNNLGINEKIGHGQSRYAGSIATRIHNVSLATSRVNLIILKPGQEFGFNDHLGDVSSATGFKPAYIIRSGRTELGDGGGVCQVSTTMFRAALDSGLKITKRLPHSYRVSYYELDTKPGIDATVFAGEVDLRFVNDTPGHILIHGQADPKTLTMYYDFYGTNDGRKATISNHTTWAATPPLPPEYIYDPSIAPGQRKQIDWSAPGLKAKFTYTVVDRLGNPLHNQIFTSNYRPWSAKYLVGTPQE